LFHLAPAAALLIALTSSAFAQSLPNGGVVSGVISGAGQHDTYTFTASAGAGVQLRAGAVSGTLVPYFTVYNPSNAVVVNGSINGVVASAGFTASVAGTYTVVLSDFHGTGTGGYNLYFTLAPGASSGGALPNGGSVSGAFSLGELDSYTFTASAGTGVQLRMAALSGSLVPYFTVYNPSGAVVVNGGINGAVASAGFTASVAGTYTVVAEDFHGPGIGGYNLYFTLAPGANGGGTLPNGGVVPGTINLGELDSYTFAASAGAGVQLRMAAINGSLVPYFTVYNPGGAVVVNGGINGAVAGAGFTASVAGTYTVVAEDFYGPGIGGYNLYFTLAPGADEDGALSDGATTTGTINLGELESYTFTASPGEAVQLNASAISGTLVPYFTVYNPNGAVVVNAGITGTTAAASFNATVAGTYTVVMEDFHLPGTGGYDLTLNGSGGGSGGGGGGAGAAGGTTGAGGGAAGAGGSGGSGPPAVPLPWWSTVVGVLALGAAAIRRMRT
jgi:hypothetical protein